MFFSGCTDKYRDLGIILDVSGSMCFYLCMHPITNDISWGCCKKPGEDFTPPQFTDPASFTDRACDYCDGDLCGSCKGAWCSNAVRNPGIGKGKEVVKKIANIANFTTNGSHGAFMTFDHNPNEPLIRFDDIASVDQFNKKVDEIDEDCFGGTDIIEALNSSLSQLFDYPNGIRNNTEKVAILITDGVDQNNETTYDQYGKEFKEQDITLIVIAVGNVDLSNLERLVQSPGYLFPAKDWDDLDDALIKLITAAICDGNTCFL